MDRKLAAILTADVVGYSKLMEQDEKGAFDRLKAPRNPFGREIARHDGRIFKVMEHGPTPNGQASAKPGMLGDAVVSPSTLSNPEWTSGIYLESARPAARHGHLH